MICFSAFCEDLAAYHLKLEIVDTPYQALSGLLHNHLTQGVWRSCHYPGWTKDHHQCLTPIDPLSEDEEGASSEYDEPQKADLVHMAGSLTTKLQHLDLSSRGIGGVTRAYTQIGQFSMKETECGEGKAAFEDYLDITLSIGNDTVSIH